MKKIKAFTLLELVIVMVITSLIVAAGYIAYTSSAKRLDIFRNISESNVGLTQMGFLLKKDFEECESASLTTSRQLTLFENKTVMITYRFEEEMVLRTTSTQSDTFFLSIKKVEAKSLAIDPFFVEGLYVFPEAGKKDLCLSFYKTYYPNFFMNLADNEFR